MIFLKHLKGFKTQFVQ